MKNYSLEFYGTTKNEKILPHNLSDFVEKFIIHVTARNELEAVNKIYETYENLMGVKINGRN